MSHIIKRKFVIFYSFLFVLFASLVFLPKTVLAGAGTYGWIMDKDGNGINGASVQADVYRCIYPANNPEGNCTWQPAYKTETPTSHNDKTGEDGFFDFRTFSVNPEDPKDILISGPIDCNTQVYLNVKLPGSQQFTRIKSANSADAGNNQYKVLGASTQTDSTQKCTEEKETFPCKVEGNVFKTCEGTKTHCEPVASPTPTPTPTPPPPIACNSNCNADDVKSCESAKDGCTACIKDASGNGTCQTPQVCNSVCDSTKPNQCAGGAKDGCTTCRAAASGGETCQPTVACNVSCAPGNTVCPQDCSICKPTGTAATSYSCQAPSCQCDDTYKTVVDRAPAPGQNFTVTTYYKLEGGDIGRVTIKDIVIRMYKNSTKIAESQPITPTPYQTTATKVIYQASATFTMPLTVDKTAIYRISADKPKGNQCVQSLAYTPSQTTVVLGATCTTPQQNLFQKIWSKVTNQPAPTCEGQTSPGVLGDSTNLQLKTLDSASVTDGGSDLTSCNILNMKF